MRVEHAWIKGQKRRGERDYSSVVERAGKKSGGAKLLDPERRNERGLGRGGGGGGRKQVGEEHGSR
jgi:hypothetical protein